MDALLLVGGYGGKVRGEETGDGSKLGLEDITGILRGEDLKD